MGFLEERDMTGVSTIPEYFKGKTILITGGSGFMGKILIEKLLYSCTDLDRIYLLLRNKKGVSPEDRLAQIYSSMCFDRMRKEKPDVFQSKVFVVAGDVSEIGLGISQDDRILLINRVNIVFHFAASIRFDDPLPKAVKMNLQGTKEIVNLSKEIRNLSALIHVSTSYCNTNRDVIEEVMYPPHADWRDTLLICDVLDEQSILALTPKYLGELPNTYTFTKQLAEHVVYEEKGKLPAVIIRPSIVTSVMEEPLPRWTESFNGPFGLMVGVEKGIMRSVYSSPDIILDYIPVDISIKNIIAAAWIRGTKRLEKKDDIPIYNSCAGKLVTITMREMIENGIKMTKQIPLDNTLWNVKCCINTNKFIHYVNVILFHLLPALFVDGILWALEKKTLLIKIQRRIYIATLALRHFLLNQWTFDNKNFIHLRSCIKEEDRKQFYYKYDNSIKKNYMKTAHIGLKQYLLKEKLEDLPKARIHFKRVYYLDKLVQSMFYGCLFWWIINMVFVKYFSYDLGIFMVF